MILYLEASVSGYLLGWVLEKLIKFVTDIGHLHTQELGVVYHSERSVSPQ